MLSVISTVSVHIQASYGEGVEERLKHGGRGETSDKNRNWEGRGKRWQQTSRRKESGKEVRESEKRERGRQSEIKIAISHCLPLQSQMRHVTDDVTSLFLNLPLI